MQNLLVCGGAGFIGTNFVELMLERYPEYTITVYDKLTYAGRIENIERFESDPRFAFVQGDICDAARVRDAITQHKIDTLVNFAAETHVDRSILDPDAFVRTNMLGAYVLCEATKDLQLERFHHISTDEVYGPIPSGMFKETDAFNPTSPYAAAKAGGELLIISYIKTYNLPITITRGVNTYGPYQYPEKAIPLFVTNAIDDLPIPLYGDGSQVRDRLHARDHAHAVDVVLHRGTPGEAYNVAADMEHTNIDVLRRILKQLGKPESLIAPVKDRAAHDVRYALDASKLGALGWEPQVTFAEGLEETVRWYVAHEEWWRTIKAGDFQDYYRKQYVERA